jgi:hypothetical protein
MGKAERAKPSDVVAIVKPLQPPDQASDSRGSYVPPNTLLDKTPGGKSTSPAKALSETQSRPGTTPIDIPVTIRGPQPVQAVDDEAAKKGADVGNGASSGLQESRPRRMTDQDGQGTSSPGTASTEKQQ